MTAAQPLLTQQQLTQYIACVSLPTQYHPENNPPLDHAFLAALHKHHITTFPYENLSLHYSRDARIALETETVCGKFFSGRGRGGYCFEHMTLFNSVLRTIGFSAYMTGVRIRYRQGGVPMGDYSGWVHVVNIVTLSNETRWAVDSGFGGDGMTTPLPLKPDAVTPNIGSQEVRLARGPIPGMVSDRDEQFWIYQYRNAPELPWNSFFAFGETEFRLPDLEIMNWYTGAHPHSFQTFTAIIVKFLRSDAGEVVGKVMLVNGDVKRNLGGKTEVVCLCKTEEERIQALREWFGIELTEEERLGIRGRVAELKAT